MEKVKLPDLRAERPVRKRIRLSSIGLVFSLSLALVALTGNLSSARADSVGGGKYDCNWGLNILVCDQGTPPDRFYCEITNGSGWDVQR